MSFVTPEFKEASRVWKEAFGVRHGSWGEQASHCKRHTAAVTPLRLPRSFPTCVSSCPAAQRNFDKPVEWSLQKEFPWSEPTLMRLQQPLTVDGKPWPLDASGKPAVSAV